MKKWLIFLVVFVLAAGSAGYWYAAKRANMASAAEKNAGSEGGARKGRKSRGGGGGPLAVKAEKARIQPMPVVIDAVGTMEAEQSVAVRPQVSGVLEAILFREGDPVKAGQLLFRIDPRPFQASVNQARAAVARDEAQLAQARAQQGRLEPLVKEEYITKQEFDVATTSTKSFTATVDADRAALEQARLQLGYTQIHAPISGRSGSLAVKAGNLVTAASGSGGAPLVVINSMHPILVAFSVSQKDLDELRKVRDYKDLKVEVYSDTGDKPLADGRLVFVDNAINPQTGGVLLKARLPNERELLWPGEFVKVRVILRVEPEAVVVSEDAVQPGQQGSYVYLIDEGKVKFQPVVVSRQLGSQVVIASGLKGGQEVITEVPQALNEGIAVRVIGSAGAKDREGKSTGTGKGNKGKSKNSEQ